ncbi:hypothetical protein [Bacillus sp. V2I10]|uniref:hypothetical protein n=1 Tax=Bacillus sp. V2I10 TaxID=3042276 RepID=UPI00278110C9|nr:hypothetical protein [Bacillus sp. V2I10]MDQ0861690.1 hypothetical protein [Bacillus sp. V2I10]
MSDSKTFQIPEEMVARYALLNEKAKRIEEELAEMKKIFNSFFDHAHGNLCKGEERIGDYKIQRQIRHSEQYHPEKTVKVLEDLNLTDCIISVKQPDKQKIDAALTLGMVSEEELKDCLIKKSSQAIVVKPIK